MYSDSHQHAALELVFAIAPRGCLSRASSHPQTRTPWCGDACRHLGLSHRGGRGPAGHAARGQVPVGHRVAPEASGQHSNQEMAMHETAGRERELPGVWPSW